MSTKMGWLSTARKHRQRGLKCKDMGSRKGDLEMHSCHIPAEKCQQCSLGRQQLPHTGMCP